jgi:hypothetical protein
MPSAPRLLDAARSSLLVLVVLACATRESGEARRIPFGTQRTEIDRSATELARSFAAGDGYPACHVDSVSLRTPALLLAVSADQCLGCKSVGRIARALARGEFGNQRAVLVTPIADTADVCSFLRVERVQLPVIGFAAHLFPDTALTSDVVMLGVRAGGTVSTLLHAREGLEVLVKGRAILVDGSP